MWNICILNINKIFLQISEIISCFIRILVFGSNYNNVYVCTMYTIYMFFSLNKNGEPQDLSTRNLNNGIKLSKIIQTKVKEFIEIF